MQHTIEPSLEMAAQATCRIEQLSDRLIHLLSFVPDDKLAWTPSPTAKSALRIAVHCALVSRFVANVISGTVPPNMLSADSFSKTLNDAEERVTSRMDAVALVKLTSTELTEAISRITAEKFETAPASPFGPLPMTFWVTMGGDHLAAHIGQVEYLQTIWGDLDNHMS